ncbi:hypothetical protein QTP88_020095 [Uroleucon formosanum]
MEEFEDNPRKVKKYETKFKESWLINEKYKKWLVKIDEKKAKCSFCNVNFTVKWDGEKALTTHLNSENHKKTTQNLQRNSLMTTFMTKRNSSDELKVAIIEIASIYHAINHHHSYLSMDCGIKLNTSLYGDSVMAKKVHCGRTKAEAIVKNILSPNSIELAIQDLKMVTAFQNCSYFSIAIDASNKGSQKMYPISTFSIFTFKKKSNLDVELLSGFSADNASVNYGVRNSVYQKLLEKHPETKIIKANCNCHVIHNASRNSMKQLTYDVENLVLKVYAEFSNSAKRVKELQIFFEEFEIEYRKVLRHGPTRWLSLFNAVDRLIMSWPAVSSYFKYRGEEKCHQVIWMFVKNIDTTEMTDLSRKVTLPECFLYFIHHYMNILSEAILILETNSVTSVDLHNVMQGLKDKIENRLNDSFYGAKVTRSISSLQENERVMFKKEANEVYKNTIDYLKKNYDFNDSIFKMFSNFNLKNKIIEYDDAIKSVNLLGLNNIEEDRIYDEVKNVQGVWPELSKMNLSWVELFKKNNFTELPKIIGKIFSIPISNAFVERVFSLMGNLWSDERNRLSVEMVKSELCVK